ncbi:SDR family NAD(P)-dependent oxidoreductase [Polyangium jinanense]|uniref:SDR family oxidoreductase n=1 Tax=Polyangium jinanense TaxID=2829994 RepID=A0A9X4ARI5_9BACT|nr:SDR family NAD(P)-dependent oxidoreductase [Polyangium jinanense]MDC3955170.1 SDR family oxidoreductase [Polyangium jinanense]MDC3981471.1 SDR family oxidoreductase [Polyangium jinanense]
MSARVALVTGASRGIGAALVERFHEGGFSVAALARSRVDSPHAAESYVCDVSDAGAVAATVRAVLARFGRIDVLVNNAGLAGANSLDPEGDDAFWHQVLAVNLNGTYYLCKQVLPHLPDGAGRIINISSVLGLKGAPDQTAYTAAKHGVIGFTRALALHAAPRRITVNAICPGWTRTAMAEGRMRELGLDEAALGKSVPLGRMIEPREVANLAFHLASEDSAGITGQAIVIDGGALV